jgi:hypothetical protein
MLTSVCRSDSPPAPVEIEDDRIAVVDAAALDWLEARAAIAQALQRAVHGFLVDPDLRAAE